MSSFHIDIFAIIADDRIWLYLTSRSPSVAPVFSDTESQNLFEAIVVKAVDESRGVEKG